MIAVHSAAFIFLKIFLSCMQCTLQATTEIFPAFLYLPAPCRKKC